MEIKDSVALVTGANRGIGHAFVRALVDHGAAKVYAGVRDLATVADPDVTPLQLDVTNPAEIAAATESAPTAIAAASRGTKIFIGAPPR